MGRRRDLPFDAGTRLGAVILGLATCLFISELPSPAMERRAVEVEHEVRIYGAPPQIALSSWAVRRFQRAGLVVPHAEIHFYADLGACDGHLGYTAGGRIDVCTLHVDAMSRHAILHELAHVWLDANTSQLQRDRFLELRGLSAWNKTTDSWMLRGYEQAAELMAWVLGERIITPKIPNNDPALLAEAFELLTGIETSTAAELPYPEGSKGILRAGVPPEGLEDPVGEIPDVRETRQTEVHIGPHPTSSGSSTVGVNPVGRGHEPTDHDAGWDSSGQGFGRHDPVSQHRRGPRVNRNAGNSHRDGGLQSRTGIGGATASANRESGGHGEAPPSDGWDRAHQVKGGVLNGCGTNAAGWYPPDRHQRRWE